MESHGLKRCKYLKVASGEASPKSMCYSQLGPGGALEPLIQACTCSFQLQIVSTISLRQIARRNGN